MIRACSKCIMMIAIILMAQPLYAQGILLPDYATAAQGFATAGDLKKAIAGMHVAIGERSIAVQPVARGNGASAALEYWRKPLLPAAHSVQVEYVVVLEGSGKLVYGGTLSSPREVRPGQMQGDEIIGGQSRELHPGDVFLIPAGVPHWFGPGPDGIVMLGTKFAPLDGKKDH